MQRNTQLFNNRKVWIVLPCYNEAENLNVLFNRFEQIFINLKNLGYKREYIVVDDGSSDKSNDVLIKLSKNIPIQIITHNPNKGLGMTIKDGLKRASEVSKNEDIIITMDSDNSQPPELIVPMISKILEGNHIVIASRYRYGARVVGLAKHREILSIFAAILFKISYNIKNVKDYTCGFRAYDSEKIKLAFSTYKDKFIEQEGFQCMAEILIKLNRIENTLFYEVPMILRYDDKKGISKMKVTKTILNTIKMLITYKFKS